MRALRACALLLALFALGGFPLRAGGPLAVGGPTLGINGVPFLWDVSEPIAYRTDGGMLGAVSNEDAVARVRSMFDVWQNVPTAAIAYSHSGSLLAVVGFSDGDVSTFEEYVAVTGSCSDGVQNPIVFDVDGSIMDDLLGPGAGDFVLGVAGACALTHDGRIAGGDVLMNGRPLLDAPPAAIRLSAVSDDSYDAAIIHEIGHFSGLDHAQINLNCLTSFPCPEADRNGVPTMFPILLGDFMKVLSQDDIAWISTLYPKQPEFDAAYGKVSGRIFLPDGATHAPGVNVIARRLVEGVPSRSFAISVVSGFLFTGGEGPFGSDDPGLRGFFEFALPTGQYSVEVEAVHSAFVGGSGVGPFDPPEPLPGDTPEYWNGENESHSDDPSQFSPVTVTAGQSVTGINVILNGDPGVKRRRGQLISE